MARFSIQVKPSAQKELDALDDALFARIDAKILALTDNPRPVGAKKLHGYKDHSRIRVGDYRVVYSVDPVHRIIHILRVRHRREVY